MLAVCLAVVTIMSHRSHTAAVVQRTEANDQWTFYQSKRIKFHSLELGIDMLGLLGKDKAGVEEAVTRYRVREGEGRKGRQGNPGRGQGQGRRNPPHRGQSAAL